MNKEELQKKCAELIGVSTSEKELAFEVLQDKILQQLNRDGDALRINDLGVFQFKLNEEENSNELIFSPIQSGSGSKTLFLRFPVKKTFSGDDTIIDDIFSLSVGKPIVPFSQTYETGGDSDSSFVFIKKKIEERVSEILSSSQFLANFNLWDDYLRSMEKDSLKERRESESSLLLRNLTEPDPEPEEEELDPFTKSHLTSEMELYSYPIEDDKTNKEEDEFLSDYETFKSLTEDKKEDDNPEDNNDDNEKVEQEQAEQVVVEEPVISKNIIEENKTDEEIKEDSFELSRDDIFDLEKTVFNSSFEEGDKVDWNWGDELKSKIPEEEPKIVRPTKIAEEEPIKEKPKEVIDKDPFGTLERTIEQDPEFRTLTGERFFDDVSRENDGEYRITNLSKPREVPPKPKTRMTRLTSPIEEPIADESQSEEKKEIYKSFRDRNSNNNVFVIAGIIIILAVIIYFAFSVGDEPSKEVIQPSNQAVQTQTDDNIVTSEPPVATTTPKQSTTNKTINTQPDNSSKVEEIRISNLIFRRGNEYNVQVSSWRSSIKADAEVQRLKARGYKAFVVQAYLPSKGGTWHRVRIGGFKSEEEARNFLNTTQL